jgi:hypothetical protein
MRVSALSRLASLCLVVLAGCMRTVQIGDQALKPFASMYSVDRAQYGFTPLPKDGSVSIEGSSSYGGYDAMLHFGGEPSRTIAFRRAGKGINGSESRRYLKAPGCGTHRMVDFMNTW